jgi:hypothetical protein
MYNPITEEMFENKAIDIPNEVLVSINKWIEKYKNSSSSEEKRMYKIAVKRLLPESFLQKRTICTNYQTLLEIYRARIIILLCTTYIKKDFG